MTGSNIWRQHLIGQTWGRFSLAASQIAIFVSTWTMIAVTINVYAPIQVWFAQHGIYLPFWMFMAIIIVPIIIAYFLAWKLLVATYYRSSTDQFWAQSKEWSDRISKIDNIDETLRNELPAINKRLEALEKHWKQ